MWLIGTITALILIIGVIIDVIGEDDNDDYDWKEYNDIKGWRMKFKIGDIVKINGGSRKGEIAVIIEVNQYPIDSIFMKYDMYKIDLDEGKYWWAENMIDLIDDKPRFTLTAEEVEIVGRNLIYFFKSDKEEVDKILIRLKQWQDENNRTD